MSSEDERPKQAILSMSSEDERSEDERPKQAILSMSSEDERPKQAILSMSSEDERPKQAILYMPLKFWFTQGCFSRVLPTVLLRPIRIHIEFRNNTLFPRDQDGPQDLVEWQLACPGG
jgi:hypothetical protein